jgi:hypothetical protein
MDEGDVSWRAEGAGAHLKCGPLEALAGCHADGLDLIVERWRGTPASRIAVLCSSGPNKRSGALEVAEQYVRGNDLIARCHAIGPHRITPHIYWRASFEKALSAARVELVLSAQTELLDSVPTWTVVSFVPGAQRFYACDLSNPKFEDISAVAKIMSAQESAQHLVVFRVASLDFSYAQMVHPSDFVSAEAPFDGSQPPTLEATFFPEHLEKGVIRRGRICGWFMPAEKDLETAVALARQFVDEPLPLTA